MQFELVPIFERMLELYQAPRDIGRFKSYLQLLEGNTNADLELPITGFNPMAGEHVRERLLNWAEIGAEKIALTLATDLTESTKAFFPERNIKLVLNLADDVKGAWTNHFATDFDNKFKMQGYVARDFCPITLWVSEPVTITVLTNRIQEQVHRFIYFTQHGRPTQLIQMLQQEKFVAKSLGHKSNLQASDFELHQNYFERQLGTEEYLKQFAFFYGDEVSASLAYPLCGLPSKPNGFDYASFCIGK